MVYDRREIDEAMQAADETLFHLENAAKYLHSAGNWGIWDMLGGGMISSFVKHSKMDEAEREIAIARDCMNRLSRELRDVGFYDDMDIYVGDFLRFADYFWDGFVVDFMVQSKIREAERKVDEAIRKVDAIIQRLERLY